MQILDLDVYSSFQTRLSNWDFMQLFCECEWYYPSFTGSLIEETNTLSGGKLPLIVMLFCFIWSPCWSSAMINVAYSVKYGFMFFKHTLCGTITAHFLPSSTEFQVVSSEWDPGVCTQMLHANVSRLFSESPLISLAHSPLLYFRLCFSLAFAQTHSGTHVNTSPAVWGFPSRDVRLSNLTIHCQSEDGKQSR